MIGISQRIYFGGTNRSNNGRFGMPDWLHLAATPAFALMALLQRRATDDVPGNGWFIGTGQHGSYVPADEHLSRRPMGKIVAGSP